MIKNQWFIATISLIVLTAFLRVAMATDFSSTNFTVKDPVLNSGNFSSSHSFRVFSTVGQPAIGISTSDNRQLKAGFLYFPEPTVVTAAAPAEAAAAVVSGGGPVHPLYRRLFDLIVRPCSPGDLNCDGRINIEDVSILFYWWGKPVHRPSFASLLASIIGLGRPSPDMNSDQRIDIFDLSMLLSRWTGNGVER
jgi:hypothetical protein